MKRISARSLTIAALAFGAALFVGAAPSTAADWTPTSEEWVSVSPPASPRVAWALRRDGDALQVAVGVGTFTADGRDGRVQIGLAAGKKVLTLTEADAQVSYADKAARFLFTIPADRLVTNEEDWDSLRFALAASWAGGPLGQDRQRERFRHTGGAPSAGLSTDPTDWQPLRFDDYRALVADRRQRITIPFTQPMDGKATIVIETADGSRVRNLVRGAAMSAGGHDVAWDGLDDRGRLMPPGAYRWRAASHPGITPQHLFSFYNHGRPPFQDGTRGSNWGADHSDPVAAAAVGDRVYIGSPIAESGNNILQLTADGVKTNHGNIPAHVGQGTLFLVADADSFYAVTEGQAWYDAYKDLGGGRWEARRPTSVLRWDTGGNVLRYDGPRGERVITTNAVTGSGAKARPPAADNLAGAAMLGGKLYVSLRADGRIAILDPKSGDSSGEVRLPKPGLLATAGESLVAFSGDEIVRIDSAGNVSPMFKPVLSQPRGADANADDHGGPSTSRAATGMAVGPAGEIFIADDGVDQNIKVFDATGTLIREIGRRGGRPTLGEWDGAAGVYRPHGIALDSTGQLWVTETDTWPRRVSVWNAAEGTLKREFFGPGFYGAPGGSFDPQDPTRWIGGGVLWSLDFATKSAKPVSTLYRPTKAGQWEPALPAYSFNIHHADGRTFVIGQARYQSVYELKPDGTLKLWAVCGAVGSLAQYPRWTLPAVLGELPQMKELLSKMPRTGAFNGRYKLPGPDAVKTVNSLSLMWVDRNADDVAQVDEIEVAPEGASVSIGYWGAGNTSLTLRMGATIGGKPHLLTLRPNGFMANGAPDYRFTDAITAATPLQGGGTVGAESIQDHGGRLIFNSSPMRGFDPSGRLLWTYPNEWVGVHGSHKAPLPETGVLQGVLWFLGAAPLDDAGDVMVMNGNHGRFFVMTSDGLYLDEMFKDVRVTQNLGAYRIGGEPFGGYFAKAADGNFYLQSGHTDYRIFRINGLADVRRSGGTLDVSPEQIAAAQAELARKVIATTEPRAVVVTDLPKEASPAKDPEKWPAPWSVQWGNERDAFPFVRVKVARQGESLCLAYQVKDPSPWLNNGVDWKQLFKTGDSVDFQFSTDPSAKPTRSGPVPGDRRLLIAPFEGKPVAVLYSHRQPGSGEPVMFSSPWRAERVDRVHRLDSAKVAVEKKASGYELTAIILLADLGLPAVGKPATLLGDFGVIYGDEAGTVNLLRSYWANKATALVSDVPGEIMLTLNLWGTLTFTAEGGRK